MEAVLSNRNDAPPLGRREKNKRDKLARITAAARTLFHQRGFERTTTAHIAELAGVAEGTLFLYVTRKEDLLILAFASEMSEVVRTAQDAIDLDADLLSQLMSFFGSLLAYHLEDPLLARAFLREVGFFRDPGRDYGFGRIPMMESLGGIVERAKANGVIDARLQTLDVSIIAFSVYWYCLRDWANEVLEPDAFTMTLRRLLAIQVRGLHP